MVIAPDSTPASLEQALALLGESRRQWDAEKRLLKLRIQSLEHRLFGTKSEKVALEDKQLALIDEVCTHPEPACQRRFENQRNLPVCKPRFSETCRRIHPARSW